MKDSKFFKFNFYIDCNSIDVIRIQASSIDEAMRIFTAVFGIELSSHILEVVRLDIM